MVEKISRRLRLLGRASLQLELVADEPEVGAVLRDKLAMGAYLDDATAIEHDNLVGVAHRAEPMSDNDDRRTARKFA